MLQTSNRKKVGTGEYAEAFQRKNLEAKPQPGSRQAEKGRRERITGPPEAFWEVKVKEGCGDNPRRENRWAGEQE